VRTCRPSLHVTLNITLSSRLRLKIRVPYHTLQEDIVRLEKLHQASDVLRRTARFVVLARRLETQMAELDAATTVTTTNTAAPATPSLDAQEDEKERTIAKAALTIAELGVCFKEVYRLVPTDAETTIVALLDAAENGSVVVHDTDDENISGIPLRSVNVVASHIPFIEDARTTVTAEMENTVLAGLTNLVEICLSCWMDIHSWACQNQALLASSLQTAHNLRVLPTLVHSLVMDLSAAVESRIRSAFDMALISKDALAKGALPIWPDPSRS
jgi:hypothetical protein